MEDEKEKLSKELEEYKTLVNMGGIQEEDIEKYQNCFMSDGITDTWRQKEEDLLSAKEKLKTAFKNYNKNVKDHDALKQKENNKREELAKLTEFYLRLVDDGYNDDTFDEL